MNLHTRLFFFRVAEGNENKGEEEVGKSFLGLGSSNRQFNELKLETNIMQVLPLGCEKKGLGKAFS